MTFSGTVLVSGHGRGKVVAIAPLSFWGGYDPATGLVIDRSHPALGRSLKGVVVVMTTGRGSSSASGAIAEAIRCRTEPAAIVLSEPDAILLTGAIVAETLYGRTMPIVVLSAADHAALARASEAEVIAEGGTARVNAA